MGGAVLVRELLKRLDVDPSGSGLTQPGSGGQTLLATSASTALPGTAGSRGVIPLLTTATSPAALPVSLRLPTAVLGPGLALVGGAAAMESLSGPLTQWSAEHIWGLERGSDGRLHKPSPMTQGSAHPQNADTQSASDLLKGHGQPLPRATDLARTGSRTDTCKSSNPILDALRHLETWAYNVNSHKADAVAAMYSSQPGTAFAPTLVGSFTDSNSGNLDIVDPVSGGKAALGWATPASLSAQHYFDRAAGTRLKVNINKVLPARVLDRNTGDECNSDHVAILVDYTFIREGGAPFIREGGARVPAVGLYIIDTGSEGTAGAIKLHHSQSAGSLRPAPTNISLQHKIPNLPASWGLSNDESRVSVVQTDMGPFTLAGARPETPLVIGN